MSSFNWGLSQEVVRAGTRAQRLPRAVPEVYIAAHGPKQESNS